MKVPGPAPYSKDTSKPARFWQRFLGAVELLKLHVPTPHNSLEETQQWLTAVSYTHLSTFITLEKQSHKFML